MKVLETNYRGVTFRSRLEARWAVFFSELSIPFIYEPEGFEFKDGTRYLPDFYLPKQDFYVEIKPTAPSKTESDKCSKLAIGTGKNVCCLYGSFIDGPEGEKFFADGTWDGYSYEWCRCLNCGQFGIEFEARADRLKCKKDRGGHCPPNPFGKEGRDLSMLILDAYTCAQNERFGI